MAVVLNVCLNTLALGLRQIYVARTLTAWIALPCVWCARGGALPIHASAVCRLTLRVLRTRVGAYARVPPSCAQPARGTS